MTHILFSRRGWWLIRLWLSFTIISAASAVDFSITPPAVSSQHTGYLTFQIGGLTNGQQVFLEKYLDANRNGVIDSGEIAVQRFRVLDGQLSLLGGATNLNVAGDNDGVMNGSITSRINFQQSSQMAPIAAQYLYRLSFPAGGPPPLTNVFTVTNPPAAQGFTGQVQSVGTNIPNAIVIALDASTSGGGRLVAGTLADGSGNYQLPLPPGTYLLAAAAGNYVASLAGPGSTLAPGAHLASTLALLPAANSIAGQIVDAANPAKGIPGLFLPMESAGGSLAIAFTDVNGNFVATVTPDIWRFKPSDWEVAFHGYLSPPDDASINTTTGSVSGVTLSLAKASALIYGTVTNTLGQPVPGIVLDGHDQSGLAGDQNTVTDGDGNYALGASLSASWELSLDSNNPLLANSIIAPGYANFSFGPLQSVRQNFTMKPAPYQITGHLRDSQGNPIAGIYIFAQDSSGFLAVGQNTAADGSYSLPVANGAWNVGPDCNGGDASLSSFGYPCINQRSTNIAGANVVLDFTVPLLTAHLQGQVIDDHGSPVAFMNIFAATTNNGTQFQATTDAGGNFDLGVVGGTYLVQLNVDANSGLPARGLVGPNFYVTIADNTTNGGLKLIPRHFTAAIAVLVRNGTNAGIPGIGAGATITANGTNYYTGTFRTDASGNALFGVFDGTWNVFINNADVVNAGYPGNVAQQSLTVAHNTNSATFVLRSCPPLAINAPSQIPDGSSGYQYSYQFAAASCYSPLVWSLAPGSAPLPAGLTLATNGLLSGPAGLAGLYNFSVRVSDGQSTSSQAVALRIDAPLQILTTSLPNATLGIPYTTSLVATNGQAPYSWTTNQTSSPLPTGLSLTSSGQITGVPTAAGIFFFVVRVTDAQGHFLDQMLGLNVPRIVPRPTLTPLGFSAPNIFQFAITTVPGQNYTVQFSADLAHWTGLITTNAPGDSVIISDPGTFGTARFYRVLVGP